MFRLRPYQEQAVRDIKAFIDSPLKNGVVVMPTGTGKSLIISEAIKLFDSPTIVLQPSKELLSQNYEKYTSYGLEASIYSASLKSREIGRVTFATIGSIMSDLQSFRDKGVKNLIMDECDVASKEGNQLDTVLDFLGIKKMIGLTATPVLMKNTMEGSYLQMMNRSRTCLFDEIIHVTQIKDILDYWTPIRYRFSKQSPQTQMLRLNTTGNDYTQESLKKFYDSNSIEYKILKSVEWLKTQDINQALIFVPSVDEAESIARQIKNARWVSGKTKQKERDESIRLFKSGDGYMVNVDVLGTGFDYPSLPAIIHGRPTGSLRIYYQHIGRIVRQAPNKPFAYFLDLAGNVEKFGRVEDFKLQKVKDKWEMFAGEKQVTQNGFKPRKFSVSEILELEEGIRNYVLSFGKYKDWNIVEVLKKDKKYLQWMASDKFEPLTDSSNRDKISATIILKHFNLI